ncbi:exodeoxyribonuclease VII large subunit [Haladaptatus sp. F3-133]|uniref:Exodeoxyribonuclease VII large subunit n=1 Tax=Halorutilus salinus TaxID=2487751 RepID=A0A9Q4GGY2_9EURY|nr:exodeoxyribonuclease VII large subunit [Halorutilus salinus]MCX2818225.1 exodeoxyribonuclease VII large subunit [Halorutilus salinus]
METRLTEFSDDVLSVSEVTDRVSRLLDDDRVLSDARVRGEVSDFSHASSGHMYFTLKDDETALSCVMFRSANGKLGFEPDEGDDVVAEGGVSVYEARGEYQLYVRDMERAGRGERYEEYLRLRSQLEDEGLFDNDRKKTLPDYPTTVGVATSASGAAVHDVHDVVSRRFPARVLLAPTRVQGDGSAEEIADAVERLDSTDADVLVVGRGGGSVDDLWAFNEEAVPRAIADCETPVVSAVGHEVDVTLADLSADERAATPSEAAELVVPDDDEIRQRLDGIERRIRGSVERAVESRRRTVESHEEFLRRAPVVDEYAQRIDELDEALRTGVKETVEDARARVDEQTRLLESVSPLKVLSRGYSVVESEDGVVETVEDVSEGDSLVLRLADGDIETRVEELRPDTDRTDRG